MGNIRNDKYIPSKDLQDVVEEWATDDSKKWSTERAKAVADRFMRIWRKKQKRKQAGL